MPDTRKNNNTKITPKDENVNVAKNQNTINMYWEDKFDVDDLNDRRLYINSDIDESIISTIVYHILRYNREDKNIPVSKRKPIRLYINTCGGSVFSGMGLVDAIISSKTPVYTINQAMCASMGFYIFIAGTKRYSMPNATFLMHDGQTMIGDSNSKLKDFMKFIEDDFDRVIKEHVITRTKISEDVYANKYRVEWYFLPQKAKELGVVDYIISEDCPIDDIL